MKKKVLGILGAAALILTSLCMTSCLDILNLILPEFFGTIISVNATGIDGGAIVSWETGSISSYELHLSYGPSSSSSSSPIEDKVIEDNEGYLEVKNLTNGTEYTFTLYLLDRSGNVTSPKSAVATPSADSSQSHTYDPTNPSTSVVKLDPNKSVITLTGISGKTITYANVNTSLTSKVSSSAVRKYIPKGSGSSASVAPRTADFDESLPELTEPTIKQFVPPASDKIQIIPIGRRSGDDDTFDKTNPQIGQTRYIYVDQNADLTSYAQEEMTLYAIGYDATNKDEIKSLVWVNSENVANSSRGNKINLYVIRSIVEKFSSYYGLEEQVFGSPSDEMIKKGGGREDMAYSPTGKYINIVLTDIGKDYGKQNQCGVVGYFWARDYYKQNYGSAKEYASSNEGKYFYIDIPYCNYTTDSSGNPCFDGTDSVSDTTITTLFHEYQHMINFNTKNMTHGLDTNDCAWYNEMLSMLCEDMMQAQLGVKEDESVQSSRIPNFNGFYYYSGTAQFVNDNSWVSYATAYTFGAWLTRNYGGVALVSEMSRNDKVGIDSIVAAVNSVNGTNKKWNDLFLEYVQAVGLRASYTNGTNLPTLNKKTDSIASVVTYTPRYKYPDNINDFSRIRENGLDDEYQILRAEFTTGINLWKSSYGNQTNGGTSYYGPIPTKIGIDADLQPTGFIFHTIGNTNDKNTLTFTFTGSNNENDSVYIFIQDTFSPTSYDSTPEAVN